jgi:ferredoxin-NADP reductase
VQEYADVKRVVIIKYKIASIANPAPETKVFRMEPADGAALKYMPGQFVFLHILDKDGNTAAKKPYSLASSPDEPFLEFCIKIRHGNVTGMLDQMAVGSVVGIEGPFGHFIYEGQREAGFIAGGVGIAPFIGMLRYIAGRRLKGRFALFYSAKTKDSLLYLDELSELHRRNPDIKLVITLTREAPPGWQGECGRLSEEMIMKHVEQPGKVSWWICGPLEMVGAMKTCLVKSGKDGKDIRMEGWG